VRGAPAPDAANDGARWRSVRAVAPELAVFWHDAVLEHDTGVGVWETTPSDLIEVDELHPENAERLRNMRSILERGPLAGDLAWRAGRLADEQELETVHDPAYVAELRAACEAGGRRLGYTTVLSPGSWRPLLAAVGTTREAPGDSTRADPSPRPPA